MDAPGGRPAGESEADRRGGVKAEREAEGVLGDGRSRTLLETIDAGFCIVELVYGADGGVADLVFRDVNASFERQAGLVDVVGRSVRSLMPHYEGYWLDRVTRVAQTGEPEQVEDYQRDTDRWYRAHYSRVGGPGSPLVAAVFEDVSERRRAQAALEASEARQAFLVRLGDTLRPLADPGAIQSAAARLLGEHLGAHQVHYGEIAADTGDEATVVVRQGFGHGLPPMVGTYRHRAEGWGERLLASYRAGRTAVCADVDADPGISADEAAVMAGAGFRAYVAVPLVKAGAWVAVLAVHGMAPRQWTPAEVALVEETAERTWAAVERARAEDALRVAQARMRGQKEAFQAAIDGAPLDTSLGRLARLVAEETGGEARTAFYVANAQGTRLHPVWRAGDMPASYLARVDGFVIGDDSLACGLAVPTGLPVLTPDVREEPRWKPWLDLAQAHDYRGCWSFPIKTRDDRAIGTFAMYFRAPREPGPRDLALADVVTRAAGILIASHTEARQRTRAEDEVRRLNEALERRVEARTADLLRADAARRQVLRQLVTAEEDERRRISRELHDSLGQLVTGLLLGLKVLERGSDGDRSQIEDLERLADRIGREMQHMAVQLRPPALDNLGLRLALQAHMEEWSQRHGIESDFHSVGLDGERFAAEVETTLYRVVQEGLNNAVKHAGATRVSLVLECRNSTVGAILEDNGRGFDVDATLASPDKARRLGLRGMRERVGLLGGALEIESAEGAGTTLFVRIPLAPEADAGCTD